MRAQIWLGWSILLASLLLALGSCSKGGSTLDATPIPKEVQTALEPAAPPVLKLCGNLTCRSNQACVKGACQCLSGTKSCAGACIPKSSCCSEKDCQATESCVNNTCQFSCSRVICPTNQVCDESQKRCTCPSGYRFCQVQDKCIPQDHCCDKFDCGRGETCIATVHSARVCLLLTHPACKYLGDKTSKVLKLENNQSFDVTAAEFIYGGKVKIQVDDTSLVMSNNDREVLPSGVTVAVDDVRELGGGCRPIRRLENI